MSQVYIRPDLLHAWHGQSLLIVNTHGECNEDQLLSGIYFRNVTNHRVQAVSQKWLLRKEIHEAFTTLSLNGNQGH